MKIYIKIINGDLLRVKIPKASTIAHLKQQILTQLMEQDGEETDLTQVKALSWCASNAPVWGWDIKELKLQKIHAGLWREKINSAASEELGLAVSNNDTNKVPACNRI